MKVVFGFKPDMKITKRKGEDFFILTIKDEAKMKAIFKTFYPPESEKLGINHLILQNECDKAAFIRGAFLTGGTVTNPEKSYYMDLTTPSLRLSNEMQTLISEYDIPVKTVVRRGTRVLYFRGSEKIENMLQIMGAFNSYFEFLNAKIEKETRNGMNRTLNCDSGNAKKSLIAAKKQIKAINYLKRTGKIESLPEDMKRVALLRIQNEDLSINEIGKLCGLSKTAVYSRLSKIEEAANKFKAEKKQEVKTE